MNIWAGFMDSAGVLLFEIWAGFVDAATRKLSTTLIPCIRTCDESQHGTLCLSTACISLVGYKVSDQQPYDVFHICCGTSANLLGLKVRRTSNCIASAFLLLLWQRTPAAKHAIICSWNISLMQHSTHLPQEKGVQGWQNTIFNKTQKHRITALSMKAT